MTELSPESRALLDAEGPLDEPTTAELEAMRARVDAALGSLALPPVPSPAPTLPASKTVAASSIKLLGGAVALAVTGGTLLFAVNQPVRDSPAPRAPKSVVSDDRRAPAVPAPSARTQPEPDASARSLAPTLRRTKPAAPTASVAAAKASEEALLVATAEAQLRAGHPAAALALYERHLQEYPKGALRRESQTGRIVALCGMGRSGEVRAEVERFAAKYPGSPTALRLQRACGIEPQ